MRVLAVVIVVLTLSGIGAVEVTWRLDHPLLQPSTTSPNGSRVADARSMPEGSEVPYGSGVFLRPKSAVLLSMQAELAFAGYCGALKTQWPSEHRVDVDCELLEGTPIVRASAGGTSVNVSVRPKQTANRSVERMSKSSLRTLLAAAHP
jgi:hypothetical protein